MEIAEIFPWNENFVTGLDEVDEQHKTLVRLVNLLASHLASRSDVPTMTAIFEELARYALHHFKTEERAWFEHLGNDSWALTHRREHMQFVQSVREIREHSAKETSDEVVEQLLSFLTHWLAFHILESDKRMAMAVQAVSSGEPLDSAKTQAEQKMTGSIQVLIDTILGMYDALSARTLQLTREIIERQKAEARLHLAAIAIENTLEQICITDHNSGVIEFNPAFKTGTGFDPGEIVGSDLKLLKDGLNDPVLASEIGSTIDATGHWSGEICNRSKSGELQSEWMSLSRVLDDSGTTTNYIAVFSNISQLATKQMHLERAANYDALTKLPNRLLLADRLALAIAQADRNRGHLAVCYMDLDGFKQVNDRLGHAAGDLLLKTIGERCTSVLRSNDTMARLGGDEFVLLLNDLKSPQDCAVLLNRLMHEIDKPVLFQEAELIVGASIGVSFYPSQSRSPDDLLNFADQAMYTAKSRGKNRFWFHEDVESM